MRSIRVVGGAIAAAMVAASSPLQAASVDVDVDITLPGFLMLYCYDDIAIDISAANLATVLGATNDAGVSVSGAAGPTGTVTPAPGSLTADMEIDTNTTLSSTFDLTLQNTCGVRAIAAGGTATITIPSFEATLEANGGGAAGNITVSSVTTSDSGPSGLSLVNGFGSLNTFDVTMALDISNVTSPGLFEDTDGSTVEFVVDVSTP